jgi:hypothetical protein
MKLLPNVNNQPCLLNFMKFSESKSKYKQEIEELHLMKIESIVGIESNYRFYFSCTSHDKW